MSDKKTSTLKQFPGSFWSANFMEIFERMAWYGFFSLSSIYITGAVADGGLGFSSEDRGLLQGVVSFFVYLLPFLTGAMADRYGYKKTLLTAYIILAPTYLLLGQMKTMPTFFAVFMLLGIGAAIFKPVIVATVGKTTNEKTGSLGFGIFYMMINIGGLLGPFIAAIIRNQGWNYVFIASAIWISINIPIVLFFFKEPTHEAKSGQARSLKKVMQDMMDVLGNTRFFVLVFVTLFIMIMGSKWLNAAQVFTYSGIWIGANLLFDLVLKLSGNTSNWRLRVGNARFLLFLLLLSSFWSAFVQVFTTLPEYIRDFSNTKEFFVSIAAGLTSMGFGQGTIDTLKSIFVEANGTMKPEQFVNINALCIIVFQLIVSFVMTRLKPLMTVIIGIALTAASFFLFTIGANPIFVILGVAIFSFGEMMASPTAKLYTAHFVAPQDKVAMYMGYYMWSNALGYLFGGILSGNLYGWLARDMQRPDLMWIVFACFSIVCSILLLVYHNVIGKKIDKEQLES